jgi:hypothetical protein
LIEDGSFRVCMGRFIVRHRCPPGNQCTKGHRLGISECRLSTRQVQSLMASGAQGNQIRIVIRALLAAQLLVMDLQVSPGTTDLASPAIPAQYLFSQLVIRFGIKPQARPLGPGSLQEALAVTSCRKACRCSPGRNLKNRDIDCTSAIPKYRPVEQSNRVRNGLNI